MDNGILTTTIAAGGVVLAAVAGALIKGIRNRRELETIKADNAKLTDTNGELRRKYEQLSKLLDKEAEQSERRISYQVAIMDNKIDEVCKAGRIAEVSILGINATGPLHQGREVLLKLLEKGGKLRVLLLDPNEPAFAERCSKERDRVGRIMAELFASFYILLDIRSQAAESDPGSANRLEVRLHNRPPDSSLIMVNAEDPDGVVLENPYPERFGSRGVEGEAWMRVQRGRDRAPYLKNVTYFESLWNHEETRRVQLCEQSGMLQISAWPFVILS